MAGVAGGGGGHSEGGREVSTTSTLVSIMRPLLVSCWFQEACWAGARISYTLQPSIASLDLNCCDVTWIWGTE